MSSDIIRGFLSGILGGIFGPLIAEWAARYKYRIIFLFGWIFSYIYILIEGIRRVGISEAVRLFSERMFTPVGVLLPIGIGLLTVLCTFILTSIRGDGKK